MLPNEEQSCWRFAIWQFAGGTTHNQSKFQSKSFMMRIFSLVGIKADLKAKTDTTTVFLILF